MNCVLELPARSHERRGQDGELWAGMDGNRPILDYLSVKERGSMRGTILRMGSGWYVLLPENLNSEVDPFGSTQNGFNPTIFQRVRIGPSGCHFHTFAS